MSRSKSFYCPCSTCRQVRNQEPKHYRYLHSLREFFSCSFCVPQQRILTEATFHSPSTITFRDIDVTHKHCSKHEVMVKASRPHLSKYQHEEIRQRVREANLYWTRMSILPANLIEFIFNQKESLPLCPICYENLSQLRFNLCHRCLRRVLHTDRPISTDDIELHTFEENKQIVFDCHQGESNS